jgi:hypothetical protein
MNGEEGVNVLKAHLRITVETLLRSGTSHREIARRTGVDRKTIRRHVAALANSSGVATGSEGHEQQMPPPRPPALDTPLPATLPGAVHSACEAHRTWIEAQVTLGRNAVSIYQDLVEAHGFAHRYNSVKRFVAGLKTRAPERFDVLEFLPGEEAQVDYGQGAPTLYHTVSGNYAAFYRCELVELTMRSRFIRRECAMQRVKRSRLRANVWRELVAKFALSDLTVGAFCSQEGIGTSSFNRWRARLSGNGGAEPPAVR